MLIDKKTIENLARLARITLSAEQETLFAEQLEGILEHFKVLADLPAKISVLSAKKQEIRADVPTPATTYEHRDRLIGAFPEQQDGYLKIPPIFK